MKKRWFFFQNYSAFSVHKVWKFRKFPVIFRPHGRNNSNSEKIQRFFWIILNSSVFFSKFLWITLSENTNKFGLNFRNNSETFFRQECDRHENDCTKLRRSCSYLQWRWIHYPIVVEKTVVPENTWPPTTVTKLMSRFKVEVPKAIPRRERILLVQLSNPEDTPMRIQHSVPLPLIFSFISVNSKSQHLFPSIRSTIEQNP